MKIYQVIKGKPASWLLGSRGTTQAPYEICEFYHFRKPTLRPGFQPCQGGVVQQADTLYPEAWAYLQTEEGQLLCTTEAEWQAMTQAAWGDGTFKASWNGIGGAAYYVQDLDAGTLRMPDLRGMIACSADASLGVGAARGDTARPVAGHSFDLLEIGHGADNSTGPFYRVNHWSALNTYPNLTNDRIAFLGFDNSRVTPTGTKTMPPVYGVLTCAYLGQPAAA